MPRKATGRASGHVRLVPRRRGAQWYAKYRRPDGQQVQRRLGPAWERTKRGERCPDGYYTQELAEAELHRLLAEAERETASAAGEAGAATFREAAAEYLRFVEEVRQIDAATVKDYRGVIDGYLVPTFGDEPIDRIEPNAIDTYKERLIAEGKLSPRVIVRHLTVLHGIFKRAKRVWGLERNPAAADVVERPKVVYTGEYDTYAPEEVELLAGAAADAQDAAIYRTAAYTGLRQGELLALRWRDVDFVGGFVHVRRNYTDRREKVPKGKRVRSVPMMPDVVDTLGRLKERAVFVSDDDLVFCDPVGGYVDSWALRRRYYRAVEAAGLRRLRFHDLRHTFGTQAVREFDGFAVQSLMGHAHYSTTQRYLHHKPRPDDALKLARAFGRDVSRPCPEPAATERNGAQEPETEAA